MRQQGEAWKLMRLREAGVWYDSPRWYGQASRGEEAASGAASSLGEDAARWMIAPSGEHAAKHAPDRAEQQAAAGFVTYDASVPAALLEVPRLGAIGEVPLHHLRLMQWQLRRLRSALFVSRLLSRALVLPPTLCSCELGFFTRHVHEACRAPDHPTLPLPYLCPIDHYLSPAALADSPFAHRERGFLEGKRTAGAEQWRRQVVLPCPAGASCFDGSEGLALATGASEAELVRRLGRVDAPVLHFADIEAALGRFESSAKGAEWHEQAQELLDAYCCTTHPNFMKRGQTVPYILPHLPAAWPGRRRDDYFEPYRKALGALFEAAGDNETARAFRE